MPPKILISACLLGRPVRYDGKGKPLHHPAIARWQAEGRIVGYCPEQAGGLPTPRPPAEIEGGMGGDRAQGPQDRRRGGDRPLTVAVLVAVTPPRVAVTPHKWALTRMDGAWRAADTARFASALPSV